jgi:predicted Zn-ribbon and HTH transcriptional regulator
MIQQTSIEAYKDVLETLGERQSEVYEALKQLGEATNTMISRYLMIPINCVTPRVFELRDMKLVGVSKVDKCIVTGRKSIYWKAVK